MTPQQFKEARRSLGLTVRQLAHVLNTSERTVRKWEFDGEGEGGRPPNPVACRVLSWLTDHGFRPPEWPR